MLGYFSYPFDRQEHLDVDCVVATYLVYGADYGNIMDKAGGFAVGQTVGTWVKVPGISDAMVEQYQGRVLSLEAVQAADSLEQVFVLRLAFPTANFGGSFTTMMTGLVGNDVSTALRTKLVDLELRGNAAERFPGPKKGMEDLRMLTGVEGRPLVLNMIKPCIGFTPEEGAKLFYEVAKGGVDMVKDDELLASPDYCPVAERTRAYLRAAKAASEVSGRETLYVPNITGSPKGMRENAKAVIDAGAKACLVNFVFGGLDALAEICEEFGDDLFIFAHYAGVGVLNWERGGIANNVFIGLLPRLAGAHGVISMFPDRSDKAAMYDLYRTVQAQSMDMGRIKPVVRAVGGGVTPVSQAWMQRDLGPDFAIAIGGAVQGHPMGAAEGAKATMVAVDAVSKGIPLAEAAGDCPALQTALDLWGPEE